MKLTAGSLSTALNYVNAEGKLVLLLRDQSIDYIENLHLTFDTYDVIDLTNNDITTLLGISGLEKLETLLLAKNNISDIGEVKNGNLKSLLLHHNAISSFTSLANLRHQTKLEHLILLGNKITSEYDYRKFVIWLCPSLRVLDCTKVKVSERAEAKELFGESFEAATPAAHALLNGTKTTPQTSKDSRLMENTVKKLTDAERAKLVQELNSATTLDEIERIQSTLRG